MPLLLNHWENKTYKLKRSTVQTVYSPQSSSAFTINDIGQHGGEAERYVAAMVFFEVRKSAGCEPFLLLKYLDSNKFYC